MNSLLGDKEFRPRRRCRSDIVYQCPGFGVVYLAEFGGGDGAAKVVDIEHELAGSAEDENHAGIYELVPGLRGSMGDINDGGLTVNVALI